MMNMDEDNGEEGNNDDDDDYDDVIFESYCWINITWLSNLANVKKQTQKTNKKKNQLSSE